MYFNELTLKTAGNSNKKWSNLFKFKKLTLVPIDIKKESKFYFIGSCFAEYLRMSMERETARDFYPAFKELKFDSKNEMADTINIGKFHMNYYSSASILQEFQRSWYGNSQWPPIEVQNLYIKDGKKVLESGAICYQDPYRREVFANSSNQILNLSSNISECVKTGLKNANVFVITLGLVEIFRSKKTGLVFNQFPGYSGAGYTSEHLEFHRQSAVEVITDLKNIVNLIKNISNDNKIVFSVSPVPLQMTFSQEDVFIANMYSKSTLRSAVESVIDPDRGVYYFPSYEIALNIGSDFFQERDMRHAKEKYVDLIIKAFLKCLRD
jgi:hypothetical protein